VAHGKANKPPPTIPVEGDGGSFPVPSYWKFYDLADLGAWECEPLRPIVDGIIAKGNLVYVAADTQTGKTLLGLYMAQRMLTGGDLFGRYPITPVRTVWYFVLEDPARRVQERLVDVRHEFASHPIARGQLRFIVAPGFALNDEKMWNWLELELQSAPMRLDVLFLDTYQKATPGLSSFDDQEQSRILHQLADLTRRRDLTMIVNDHLRKKPQGRGSRSQARSIDDIKGTGGKAQNADCVVLLERTNDRSYIHFRSSSKDFDVPVHIELRVAPRGSDARMKFEFVRDLPIDGRPRAGPQKSRGRPIALSPDDVMRALRSGDWMGARAIANACGGSAATTRRRLDGLVQAGAVAASGNGKARLYKVTNGACCAEHTDRTVLAQKQRDDSSEF
jgi:hypothetical protein